MTALRLTAADRAGVFGLLERDWEDQSQSRRGRVVVAGWRERPGGFVFEGMVTLADVVDALHGFHSVGDRAGADRVLSVLIGAAQAGDEMALRTVTQAMLRFAVSLTAVYRRGGADPDEAAAEVLAALQHRILAHRLDAHPAMIAGYLSLTVRRALRRPASVGRLRPMGEQSLVADLDQVAMVGDGRTTVDHVATIVIEGVRSGVLDRAAAHLLLLHAAGYASAVLAVECGRDRSVISRRIQRATAAAARCAA